MQPGLTCTLVARGVDGWRGLAATWRALETDATPAFYVTYEWLDAYWHTQGTGHEPRVYAVRNEAGRIVALAPFEGLSRRVVPSLPLRTTTLRYPCRREREGIEFLVEPPLADAAARTVARHLRAHRRGWHALILTDAPADGSVVRAFHSVFDGDPHHHVRVTPRPPTPMVLLHGTWPDYLAGMSRVTRKGILRAWRHLEALGARFRRAEDLEEVRAAVRFLVDTKNARLREVADGSVYERSEVRAFLERAVEGMLATGRLVCTVVEIGGETAAVDLGFRIGERTWTFVDAFAPRWRELGLGGRLVEHAIREGLASGATELWLGQGDSDFKSRYASETRANVDLAIERKSVAAATTALERLRRAVRGR